MHPIQNLMTNQTPNDPVAISALGAVPPTYYTPSRPPFGPTQHLTVTWNLSKKLNLL